jgi:chaperonin GroES
VDSYEAKRQDGITSDGPQFRGGIVELQLRGDRVQIESLPDELRGSPLTKTVIQFRDQDKEVSRLGKVLAIGDGKLQDGTQHVFEVAVGDTVLCQRYPQSGSTARYAGKELFFMRESEILAKVRF